MFIGPIISLEKTLNKKHICIGIWKENIFSDYSRWIFCLECERFEGGNSFYMAITSTYRHNELFKQIRNPGIYVVKIITKSETYNFRIVIF